MESGPRRRRIQRDHGGDALIETAKMIDRMLEIGDPEGRQVWRRINTAIEQL